MARYGRLPADEELASLRKQDVAAFLPTVQFRYQRELEPPDESEGFRKIEVLPFARKPSAGHTNRAVVVWCDDVPLRSRTGRRTPVDPDDVEIDEALAAALGRDREEGHLTLGLSWQPDIADGTRSAADAAAVFARMNELVGFPIDVEYCPHPAGPPSCWCRKPLPGLGVLLIHRYRLDPSRCLYIGGGAVGPGFARKLGIRVSPPRFSAWRMIVNVTTEIEDVGSPSQCGERGFVSALKRAFRDDFLRLRRLELAADPFLDVEPA